MEYLVTRSDNYLQHHGIKGQKHGVRRFQNEDGSLTAEGRDRYGIGEGYPNGSQGTGSQQSGAKQGSFVSRHKKGLAIAGGLLAAGLAGAAIYQLSKNRNTQKGAETVSEILKPTPKPQDSGVDFVLKDGTRGHYSTEYMNFRRKNGLDLVDSMPRATTPSAPKIDTRKLQRDSKKFSRSAEKAMKRQQQLMGQFDRLQDDAMRRYGRR